MEQNIYELSDKLNFISHVRENDRERFKNIVAWAGDMMDLTVKERIYRDINPQKGDIWTCNLGENVGCELNKIRPVIVISNNTDKSKYPIVTIVPISNKDYIFPSQVEISANDLNWMEKSISGVTVSEQIRSISKVRLGRKIGELNTEALKKIEWNILVALGVVDANIEHNQQKTF